MICKYDSPKLRRTDEQTSEIPRFRFHEYRNMFSHDRTKLPREAERSPGADEVWKQLTVNVCLFCPSLPRRRGFAAEASPPRSLSHRDPKPPKQKRRSNRWAHPLEAPRGSGVKSRHVLAARCRLTRTGLWLRNQLLMPPQRASVSHRVGTAPSPWPTYAGLTGRQGGGPLCCDVGQASVSDPPSHRPPHPHFIWREAAPVVTLFQPLRRDAVIICSIPALPAVFRCVFPPPSLLCASFSSAPQPPPPFPVASSIPSSGGERSAPSLPN